MWRLVFVLFLPITLTAQLKRYQFTQNKMGSPFNIIFYHTDSIQASQLANESFLLVDSLNSIFSDYSFTSEVGKLSQQSPGKNIPVSAELFNMILQSKHAWKKSGKAFDITIGHLTKLWRKARAEKTIPTDDEIKKAKQETGFKSIDLEFSPTSISFKKNIQFDFGGIVKGYAAQKVIDYLKTKNITSALADAGGDIAISNSPPGKKGWTVGINLPEQENSLWDKKLELENCSVATSGDIYRYSIYNGKKYSHIIDPGTGYGVTSQRNVTVIAKDGSTADWLATACSILSISKALKLAKKENAALLIAIDENARPHKTVGREKIITYKTDNFDNYFQKKLP